MILSLLFANKSRSQLQYTSNLPSEHSALKSPVLKIRRLKTVLSCLFWQISFGLHCLCTCLIYSLNRKESTDTNSLTIFIFIMKTVLAIWFSLALQPCPIWNCNGGKIWRFQRVLCGLGEYTSCRNFIEGVNFAFQDAKSSLKLHVFLRKDTALIEHFHRTISG